MNRENFVDYLFYVLAAVVLMLNLSACGKPPTIDPPAPRVFNESTCASKWYGMWFTNIQNELPGDTVCADHFPEGNPLGDHCIQYSVYFAIDGQLIPPRCLSRAVKDAVYQAREY